MGVSLKLMISIKSKSKTHLYITLHVSNIFFIVSAQLSFILDGIDI